MKFLSSLIVLILLGSHFAIAQDDPVYVDISPCMAMENDQSRYACYDLLEQQIKAARESEVSMPIVSIPRGRRQVQEETRQIATETMKKENSVADFGRESPSVIRALETSARILENEDGTGELIDTIAGLNERVPNQWEITLGGGQVWQQINSKRYRLREGVEVRIYPGPFGGSWRLSAANLNGFIQVRRVE
jgi:hypothetical protein